MKQFSGSEHVRDDMRSASSAGLMMILIFILFISLKYLVDINIGSVLQCKVFRTVLVSEDDEDTFSLYMVVST